MALHFQFFPRQRILEDSLKELNDRVIVGVIPYSNAEKRNLKKIVNVLLINDNNLH